MIPKLTQRDWLLITAYLDGRLSDVDKSKVMSRLDSDPQFKQGLIEIQYTRNLLRSLPQRRAPRNFMLSPNKVRIPVKRRLFQPVFGLVSAATTALLILVFAGSTFLPMLTTQKTAAPMAALSSENATADQKFAAESAEPPMIIQWNPNGGSGGGDGSGMATGMGGGPLIGGGDGSSTLPGAPTDPYQAPTNPAQTPTEVPPDPRSSTQITSDPSTLILGLPEPGTGGDTISSSDTLLYEASRPVLPFTTWLMFGLAAAALLSGILAVVLRRR
jgi:hypothetical protein